MTNIAIIWTPIVGYENLYQLSSTGLIRRLVSIKCKKDRLIKPRISSTGYYFTSLYKDSVGKNFKIHRLIAIYFIPNPLNLPFVNHKDGNKLNNEIDNLEWCTRLYNSQHAVLTGLLSTKGEKHSRSKLTNEQVRQIRKEYPMRTINILQFAEKWGIKKSTLMHIVGNRTYVDTT